MSTNMLNRRTRFPGWDGNNGTTIDCARAVNLVTDPSVEPSRSNPNISLHLPMIVRDQSPWTEYKQHLRTKQAGKITIAYDRKMREFAIKEVKGCKRDWLLRLKAISHMNIVRLIAGYFHDGSIYLVCDLMSTSLADILAVSRLPLDETATVCKGIINGLCYLHKDLMVTHGAINSKNILLSRAGDVKLGMFSGFYSFYRNTVY